MRLSDAAISELDDYLEKNGELSWEVHERIRWIIEQMITLVSIDLSFSLGSPIRRGENWEYVARTRWVKKYKPESSKGEREKEREKRAERSENRWAKQDWDGEEKANSQRM